MSVLTMHDHALPFHVLYALNEILQSSSSTFQLSDYWPLHTQVTNGIAFSHAQPLCSKQHKTHQG